MMSVSDIFHALGGSSAVARALKIRTSTASEMKRRGSIPAEYWRDLVLAAGQTGASAVTIDALADIHARPRVGEAQMTEAVGEDVGTPRVGGAGHFSRFYHVSRPHFASADAIRDHVAALRDEWDRR